MDDEIRWSLVLEWMGWDFIFDRSLSVFSLSFLSLSFRDSFSEAEARCLVTRVVAIIVRLCFNGRIFKLNKLDLRRINIFLYASFSSFVRQSHVETHTD